jgi:hypothetical protein
VARAPRLDVGVDALFAEAAAAKVDDLDGAAVLALEQHVLRLKVAVDEVMLAQEPAGAECVMKGLLMR